MTIEKRLRETGYRWWICLRRHGVMPLLLILIFLRLSDSLSCIVHCGAWVQHDLRSAFTAQHQPQNTTFLNGDGEDLNHLRPVVLANLFVCFIDPEHGSPTDTPYAPSSPSFHEHLASLVMITVLVIVFLIQHTSHLPARLAPQLVVLPPLRPPIKNAV